MQLGSQLVGHVPPHAKTHTHAQGGRGGTGGVVNRSYGTWWLCRERARVWSWKSVGGVCHGPVVHEPRDAAPPAQSTREMRRRKSKTEETNRENNKFDVGLSQVRRQVDELSFEVGAGNICWG